MTHVYLRTPQNKKLEGSFLSYALVYSADSLNYYGQYNEHSLLTNVSKTAS